MTDAIPCEVRIELLYENGRGNTGTLTAKLGDTVLHVDQLDIHRAGSRTKFLDKLCKGRPGLSRLSLERELLALAAPRAESNPTDQGDELDANTAIVRPELFHTPDVSGVCVPSVRIIGGKPKGAWVLYLRWHADGRREVRELSESIHRGDTKLLVWPTPGNPLPTQRAAWSDTARRQWLDGAAVPDGPDVFRRVCELVAHYLEFPPDVAPGVTATVACWALLSYACPAWSAVPYLSIGGPLGSGKSSLFRVLGRLCFRPLESSNMTAPCLFRTLHEVGGTLLLDEAERLRENAPDAGELRSILLSGYKKGSPAIRLEKNGDGGFKRTSFDVFGLKAFSAIARLPEALASRCIPVNMIRADPSSPKPRRRLDDKAAEFSAVRDDLHALSLEHGPTWLALARRADAVPDSFAGRDFELWQPLLAIAGWLDESGADGLHGMLTDFARKTVAANIDDVVNDADETLLTILARYVRGGNVGTLRAGDILRGACECDSATFGKPDSPRWSPKGVANRLRRYGLKTTKGRGATGRTYRNVTEADLWRLERVYGFDLGFDPEDVPTCTPCTDNPL